MTAADGSESNAFPSTSLRSLEDRLTEGFRSGRPVPIESLLAEVPEQQQPQVFSALLEVELTWRCAAEATPPSPQPYLARFPHFQSRIATLFRELLASASLPETVARGEPAPASSSPQQSTPPHTPDSRRERPEPEATVIANANPAAAAAPGLATASALPAFIGRFRVLRRLGSGGFGDVYLAEDDKLERRVAIKVPNARALREFGDNWVREARTVAQLKHPHIVSVFEVGSTPEVPAFIVSEYIAGCTLADRMKQSPLPLQQAVQLVIDVADALDYAHRSRAEVVHRDIKPGNLLLDQQERVYVADFGL
ncbi:MAG: serine/threonine-protein kinase, partial [Planctomycetaceae bacterium]